MTVETPPLRTCPIRDCLTPRWVALLVALGVAGTLCGALILQFGFGIEPCDLCHLQRIPYFVALPVALLSACLPNRSRTIRMGLTMLALIFLVNAAFGVYHSGVEWKFWAGPASCSGPASGAGDFGGDLLQQMARATVVSCSEASFRFLGLSLAGWNVIISLGFAAFVLTPFCGCRRQRRAG